MKNYRCATISRKGNTVLETGTRIGEIMKAVWGKRMHYYLIIFCFVLLMTPAVAGESTCSDRYHSWRKFVYNG